MAHISQPTFHSLSWMKSCTRKGITAAAATTPIQRARVRLVAPDFEGFAKSHLVLTLCLPKILPRNARISIIPLTYCFNWCPWPDSNQHDVATNRF